MNEAIAISTQPPADIALHYDALRTRSVQYIEQTASNTWTDYNVHDPGITILEILCYAITDLGYRSQYAIPDLLRSKDENGNNEQHFHTAAAILPNLPLTIRDYRKLILDIRIPEAPPDGSSKLTSGIRNVWLIPKPIHLWADTVDKKLVTETTSGTITRPVQLKGFYDVVVELHPGIAGDNELKKKWMETVQQVLQQHRNLGEDFNEPVEVPVQQFRLCCELELQSSASIVDTVAQLFFALQLHLTPFIKTYTLEQMIGSGYTTDQVFEGVFTKHGFIKNEELEAAGLKKDIRLSDLIQVIMEHKEVTGIPDIVFNATDQSEALDNKWLIDVKEGHQPVIAIEASNVLIYKNGIPFRADKAAVQQRFNELMEAYRHQNESVVSADIITPPGTYRSTEVYHSIQHHFPKNYGISNWGLPADASIERVAMAKQLQGYCWLFDQLMANFLAQLSSARRLLSWKPQVQSYFTQLVQDFNDAKHLFADATMIADKLHEAAEDESRFIERRNKFLDHLLSRFAESFYEYTNMLTSFKDYDVSQVIATKEQFLKEYPSYSAYRGIAFNYTNSAVWDSDNTSGYEKRVQRLLGFAHTQRRSLVNFYPVITETISGPETSYGFQWIDVRNNKTLVQAAVLQKTKEQARQEMNIAYTLATHRANFKIVKDDSDGKFGLELRDKLNNLVAVGNKGTKKGAEADLDRLYQLFDNMSEEGMFLVEHLLLYDESLQQQLPVCADPDCVDCQDDDPYSFHVSIIMPAYSKRFMNLEFRQYTEKVFREELPVHLLVKVCWVDNEQLYAFEQAYRAWLQVKSGQVADPDHSRLGAFVDIFKKLRSIYPEGHLIDCQQAANRELFQLNQHSLGTLKTS